MPGQFIDQPNPAPEASHLPDDTLKLAVSLDHKGFLPEKDRNAINKFRRAADYLAAGMQPLEALVYCYMNTHVKLYV